MLCEMHQLSSKKVWEFPETVPEPDQEGEKMTNPTTLFTWAIGWDCFRKCREERSTRREAAIEQLLDTLRRDKATDSQRFLLKRVPNDWGLNLADGSSILDVVQVKTHDSGLSVIVDRSLLDSGFTLGELRDFVSAIARHPDVRLPTELVIRGAKEGESERPYQVYSLGPPNRNTHKNR